MAEAYPAEFEEDSCIAPHPSRMFPLHFWDFGLPPNKYNCISSRMDLMSRRPKKLIRPNSRTYFWTGGDLRDHCHKAWCSEFFIIPWKSWNQDMSIVLMIGIIPISDILGAIKTQESIKSLYSNPEGKQIDLKPTYTIAHFKGIGSLL